MSKLFLDNTQLQTLSDSIMWYKDPHGQFHPRRTDKAVYEHVYTGHAPKVSFHRARERKVPCGKKSGAEDEDEGNAH